MNNIGSNFGFGFKFSSILNVHDNFIPIAMHTVLRSVGYQPVKAGEKTHILINPKDIQYKSLPAELKKQVKMLKNIVELAQTVNGFVVWFSTFDDAGEIHYTMKLDKAIEVAQRWQEKKGGKPQYMFIIDGRRQGHGDSWDAKLEIHLASQPEEEENENEESEEQEEESL